MARVKNIVQRVSQPRHASGISVEETTTSSRIEQITGSLKFCSSPRPCHIVQVAQDHGWTAGATDLPSDDHELCIALSGALIGRRRLRMHSIKVDDDAGAQKDTDFYGGDCVVHNEPNLRL